MQCENCRNSMKSASKQVKGCYRVGKAGVQEARLNYSKKNSGKKLKYYLAVEPLGYFALRGNCKVASTGEL